MALLADEVSFAEPGLKFCVKVIERTQLKMVDVVAQTDGLDASKPRMFQAS